MIKSCIPTALRMAELHRVLAVLSAIGLMLLRQYYHIYSATRQGFLLSIMTTNN